MGNQFSHSILYYLHHLLKYILEMEALVPNPNVHKVI